MGQTLKLKWKFELIFLNGKDIKIIIIKHFNDK